MVPPEVPLVFDLKQRIYPLVLQYSIIKYGTVYITVLQNTVQYTLQYYKVRYNIRYSIIKYTTEYNTVLLSTVQYT